MICFSCEINWYIAVKSSATSEAVKPLCEQAAD